MATRIEHTEISAGDRIILFHAPALVVERRTLDGYALLKIRRDNGTTGRYMIGAPVWKVH